MESYNLRSVLELPPPFRSTFNFRYFNSLQSECFPTCFQSDVNMVISAPTGSGKTVLFELCILRLLSRSLFEDGRFVHMSGTLKTIYVAPSKALVQEKLRDWTQKFGACGLRCLEMTGDNDFYNIRNVQEADIILTTPEKFDAVTRFRIRDGGLSFFSDIGLLLIDEVHLLNDPRGAALEAIVSRIKMLSGRPEMKSNPLARVRYVAVSATIPNLEDLADWLMVPPQGMKRFGEEMRPVKLTTKVFGYVAAKNDFLFEKRLQNYIFDILMQYSRGKSALVFCSTRKGAQEAAQKISQTAMTFGYSNPFIKTTEQLERLREASLSCGDKQLQSYILYGVGYHNGGLSMKDRNLIENLFLCGDIQVLCTTNTLAHGVNLPAHTVVIKSTQNYNKEKSAYTEYDRSTVLQMCGRAGRPPFDDTGLVIIMTRKETVHLYENLLSGCEIVESQLLSCMTEHLTAEIVQLTVPDITRAIEWMKCSYLYVRMKKNPETYAVEKGISRDRIERHMQDICVQKVNELSRNQMVWTDEDGFLLKPLEPGRLMTKYYLKFDTMKHIMQAQSNFSLEEALHTVCRAEELSWIQLRRNEKRLLNDINADKNGRLRFHILGDKGKKKKRIQTREEKIFILATDCLTGDPLIHELSLTQDASSICSNGSRIAKCMKEHFIFRKNYKGALNSIILAKSLHHKLWDDSPYLLKQLPGIGMVTAKALHSMGITSFETLADADPRRIEIVTGRKFPFGDHIKESLVTLPPKVELKVEAIESQRKGTPRLAVTLTRLAQAQSSKRHYADLVVGLEKENVITYHEKIRVDDFLSWSNLLVDGDKLKMRRDRCVENFNSTAVQCFYSLESSSLSFFLEKLAPKKQEFVDKGGNKDFMSKEERTLKGMTFASLSLPNGIGLYVVFSPYHTTLTLRNLEVGKLIVKADLIFEEFIGIDIHQKIDLTEEIKSNVNVRLGSKKSSSSSLRPAETCRDKGITVSTAPTKKQPIQSRFNEELDDMPSFRLLDDELDGVQPNQADNDECQIISVNKIFEHIRKKAKDFPEIKALGAVQFPVSKPPKPLREQICTEPTTDHCTSVGDHDQGAIKQGITSTSQLTSSVANYDPKESTDFQAAEKRKESQMIEPKFGHVRKRSKNSPVIVKPDSSGCGSSAQSQECSSVKEPQLSRMGSFRMKETNSGEPPVVSMLFSAPGTSNIEQNESLFMENLKDKRRLPASRTLDLPFEVSNNNPFNRACNYQTMLNSSQLRKDIQFKPPGNSVEPITKNSPNNLIEVMRGSCSMGTETGNKSVDSYLGCKSVFAFLC